MKDVKEYTLVLVEFETYQFHDDDEGRKETERVSKYIKLPYSLVHFQVLSEVQRYAICEAKLIDCGIVPVGAIRIEGTMSDQPTEEISFTSRTAIEKLAEIILVTEVDKREELIKKFLKIESKEAFYADQLLTLYVSTRNYCLLERCMEICKGKEGDEMFINVNNRLRSMMEYENNHSKKNK